MKDRDRPYLLFMLFLSIMAILALAVDVVAPLSEGSRTVLQWADTAICAIFFVDFLAQLRRAKNKWRYLATWGWLDLLSSVPTVAVLRLARAARVVRIVRVLRGLRSARFITQIILERRTQSAILAALLVSITVVAVGAIAILHFESAGDGNIKSAEDALWWATVTVTTVGYGDKFPVTTEGRVVAALLMAVGVGLFGTITGFLASWFLAPPAGTRAGEIDQLRRELRELRDLVEKGLAEPLQASVAGGARGTPSGIEATMSANDFQAPSTSNERQP